MKRFLLLPVMILLLSSCGEGTGTLSVILPENASYKIELRGKNGWKVDAETASDAFFSNLIPGIYTLEVISFKGETYGFYKKTVRIREGRNEEKVEFEKNTSLLLQIRTPSDVRDALLYIRLEGEEGITMEKKVEVEKVNGDRKHIKLKIYYDFNTPDIDIDLDMNENNQIKSLTAKNLACARQTSALKCCCVDTKQSRFCQFRVETRQRKANGIYK